MKYCLQTSHGHCTHELTAAVVGYLHKVGLITIRRGVGGAPEATPPLAVNVR